MRYAVLQISIEFLVNVFKNADRFKIKDNALPVDARYVYAFVDELSAWGKVNIVIESQEFDEVILGNPIPVLPDVLMSKVWLNPSN